MSKKEKITQNKGRLLDFKERGLPPQVAYEDFRRTGGHWRKQDFLAAYRQVTGQRKAAYNIGGAKREAVKEPKIEKYEKKKARKRVKEVAPPAKRPSGKKARTPKRKEKEARYKAARAPKKDYTIKAIDVSVGTLGQSPDYAEIRKDLQEAGIRVFRGDGGESLHLARGGKTIYAYGTAIYTPKEDKSPRLVGLSRAIAEKVKAAVLRQEPKRSKRFKHLKSEFQEEL